MLCAVIIMQIISYVGAEGVNIVIERPQDLYPLLDWFQTQIMDLGATNEQVNEISKFMELAEEKGLGSFDDVDNIEYS